VARKVRFHSSCVFICGGGNGVFGAHPPAWGQFSGEGVQTMPW
jgi:hypothetical protein